MKEKEHCEIAKQILLKHFSGLNAWEKRFLKSLAHSNYSLSGKQMAILGRISAKTMGMAPGFSGKIMMARKPDYSIKLSDEEPEGMTGEEALERMKRKGVNFGNPHAAIMNRGSGHLLSSVSSIERVGSNQRLARRRSRKGRMK